MTVTTLDDVPADLMVQIARQLRVPVHLVRQVAALLRRPAVVHTGEGYGRAELRPFLLARIPAGDQWPDTPEIRAARAEYDDGRVEICTGRDGKYLLLYRLPRRRRDTRRIEYFSRTFGE